MPIEPPEINAPSNLPTEVSGLTWTGVTGKANAAGQQLGHFVNTSNPLAPVTMRLIPCQGTSAPTWAVQTSVPTGTGELLMTSADAAIMQNGTISGGSITYGGHTYAMQIYYDSTGGWICQLLQTS